MKLNVLFVLVVLCALMLTLGAPTGTQAAGPALAPNAQGGNGDLEAFRAQLIDIYGRLQALQPYFKDKGPAGYSERLKAAQQYVAKLTPQQLAQIKDVFDKNPSLSNMPTLLQNVLKKESEPRKTPLGAGTECPPGPVGGEEAVWALKYAQMLAADAMEYVPGDLVEVVAGEGSTISAHPAKIVLAVIKDAAELASFTLEQVDGLNSSCETNNVQTLTVENLDTTITSRASQASLTQHDKDIKDLLSQNDAATKKLETQIQKTLDQQVELRRVMLQVVAINGNWQFMVSATEAGQPLENVKFLSVKVSAAAPISFVDVTAKTVVTMPTTGVYLVTLPKADITKASLYTFSVKHANDVADHFGFTLFALSANKNLSAEQ